MATGLTVDYNAQLLDVLHAQNINTMQYSKRMEALEKQKCTDKAVDVQLLEDVLGSILDLWPATGEWADIEERREMRMWLHNVEVGYNALE